jgi:hypothetical protein
MAEPNVKGAEGGSTLATELTNQNPAATPPQGTPNPSQPQPAADNTPTAELPGWTTSTTKTLRADPRFVGWAAKHKTLDEALLRSIELEERTGKMVAMPDEKATDEERAAFYEKLGVPKTPEGYKIEADKSLEIDKTQLEEYKTLAHKLKLTQPQAVEFFKLASERASKEIASFKERSEKMKAETTSALKKEWGDKYEDERAVLARGLSAYPEKNQLLKDAEETGMGNRLSFIKLVHRIGQMTQEDSALHRPGMAGGRKSDADVLYGPAKKE